MDWDSYKLLDDTRIRGLMPRIACAHDPDIEAEFPANMSGKLSLRARGEVFVRTVVVPRGEPSNFPSEAELRMKFDGLARTVLGEAQADRLAGDVLRLDSLNDGASILRLSPSTTQREA
jgi:2-methylcitrate dehydratase PrpD